MKKMIRTYQCNFCKKEIVEKFKNNSTVLNHLYEPSETRVSKKGNIIKNENYFKNECYVNHSNHNYYKIKKNLTLIKEVEQEIKKRKNYLEENINKIISLLIDKKIDFYKANKTNSLYLFLNSITVKISDHIIIDNSFKKEIINVTKDTEFLIIKKDNNYNFASNIGANYWGNQVEHDAPDLWIPINFNKKLKIEKIKELIDKIFNLEEMEK